MSALSFGAQTSAAAVATVSFVVAQTPVSPGATHRARVFRARCCQVYPAPKRLRRHRALRPAVRVLHGNNGQPQQVGPIEREAVQERGSFASSGGFFLSIAPAERRTPGTSRSCGDGD